MIFSLNRFLRIPNLFFFEQTDPDSISLAWILREVSAIVAQNPQGRYLVDMMPNLKYLHRGASFSRDCSAALRTFELKVTLFLGLFCLVCLLSVVTSKVLSVVNINQL